MTNPTLKSVFINGIDVSSYVMTFKVNETFGSFFRQATIGLKNTVSDLLNFNDTSLIETSVTIQRGAVTPTETYLFRGEVVSINFQGAFVIVNCEDSLRVTIKRTVNKSYDYQTDSQAGVISEIFKDLINNYTTLTADNTSVQNSGTVLIRQKLVLRNTTVFDAVKQLAESIDWQFYYNPNTDLVYFEPKGFTSATTTLTVGDNVPDVPKWVIDSSQMFNDIIVYGVQQEISTSEGPTLLNGVADAEWTTTSVTLNNKPVTVQVFSDTSNPPTTEKPAGVIGASSTFAYSVDKESKKITWNTATFAPTTSYYAKVNYTYLLPTPLERKNNLSIAQYGVIKNSVYVDSLKDVTDVAGWAATQVSIYGQPFKSTNVKVRTADNLNIGEVYSVVDPFNKINENLMAISIQFNYPYNFDEVGVGDKELRTSNWGSDTFQRLKRLEEKQNDNQDVLQQFIDVDQSLGLRAQLDVYKATPDADTLYWDDDNQGLWADDAETVGYNWGTDTPEPQTLSQRSHTQNLFFEDFWDSQHKDSGTTTATVSTTAHNVSFTAGQTFRSDTIFKYKTTTITSAKLSIPLTSITGTVALYLSANGGSNWEATTNASTLTFANTGTDLRYRIDSAGTSSIAFTNISGESVPLKLEVNI